MTVISPIVLANPYVGPRSFRAGETLYGRDREVQDLLGLLIAERIVLLHSPSGAGKTSLVQAQLVPLLVAQEFTVLPIMRVSLEPPPGSASASAAAQANRYTLSLLLSLEEALPSEQQIHLDELAGLSLAAYLDRQPRDNATDGEVLIFDQFEEILTVDPTNLEAKVAFFAQLGVALRDRHRWALFMMREDYIAALAPYLRHIPTRLSNTYRLDLLGVAAARQAMQQPARRMGVTFSNEAATRLLDDLRRVQVQRADGSTEEQLGPSVEPVQLQVVCYRLWENRFKSLGETTEDAHLTIGPADVEAAGDVSTALADYYAQRVTLVAAETSIGERAIREWFEHELITPQGIRGQVLQGQAQSQGLANAAIWPLIDAYLVRAEKRRGATWFELAHDRLIEPVRANNAAWRATNLSALQRQAELWESEGRPEGLLLRNAALNEAEGWATAQTAALTETEHDFLEDSRKLHAATMQERRTQRMIRTLAVVASIISVLAIALAITIWFARSATEQARKEASVRQLAAQASEAIEQYPQRALLLALEALTQQGTLRLPVAKSALYHALATAGGTPLLGHMQDITALAFSPDGRWLATGSEDTIVRVWDVPHPDAKPYVLRGHTAAIRVLSFSPDGHTLLTASDDASARIWQLAALNAPPIVLTSQDGTGINAIAFSPDGGFLATGDSTGMLRLWNMHQTNAPPITLQGHTQSINAVAFSPDGHLLAAGSDDMTAGIWDLTKPSAEPIMLQGQGLVKAVAFSPDGRLLATGSDDSIVRLWNMTTAADPILLQGHTGGVTKLAFSPSGQYLLSGSDDFTARLWDLTNPTNISSEVLRGHLDKITGLAWSPDEQLIITASYDKTTRLWKPTDLEHPIILRGHEQGINTLAVSADGHFMATGSSTTTADSADATVRLWNMSQLNAIPLLYGHTKPIVALAFGPNGKRLATGSQDHTVRIWNLDGPPSSPTVLNKDDVPISAVTFSPNGQRLATGSNDTNVRVWDLTQPDKAPSILKGHTNTIAALVFSRDGQTLISCDLSGAVNRWDLSRADAAPTALHPAAEGISRVALSADGRYLATDSFDGTVHVWDLTANTETALAGAKQGVNAIAFSPNLNQLAVSSGDHMVRLWDLSKGATTPVLLRGYEKNIFALSFSPDQRLLVGGSDDTTARLWDLTALSTQPVILQGHTLGVAAIAFSPNSQELATGGNDTMARVWPLAENDLLTRTCATVGRNLTFDEWQQAHGDAAYRKTCETLPVSPSLIDNAASFIQAGDVRGALGLSQQVIALNGASDIPAQLWSRLCRNGSLAGHAADMRTACDQAVMLDPDNGESHDSRGLARALLGDKQGAIEDFKAYTKWAKQFGPEEEEKIMQREQWIATLEAGNTPFDPQTLKELAK